MAQRKAAGMSPMLVFMLIALCAAFLYSIYLEFGEAEIPGAAVSSFIDRDADFEIHFIDVGQGDCSLIMWNGFSALIDGGETEDGDTVLKYLKKQGVKKLDYIIATHPHSDHIGGLPKVISELEAGRVIVPRVSDKMTPTTKVYQRFLQALRDKSLKMTAAKPGTKYTLGETGEGGKAPPEFEILAPLDDYEDLNDYSVVIRLTYGKTAYLFTGDAEKQAEKDILESGADVKADVLKIGHHGSSSSTGEDFFAAVSPKICVIQCGSGNSYGNPHKETAELIENSGAKLYRNDINGTVTVYSDGDEIIVKTAR